MPAKKQIKSHRDKIAAARRGKKHSEETRSKIGRSVQQGPEGKVPFSTRLARSEINKLSQVSARDKRPMSQIIGWLIHTKLK